MKPQQRRQPEHRTVGRPAAPAATPGKPEFLTPIQELQLVEQWRTGDAESLRRLLDSYQRRVFTICYRMLHHTEDAQDIAQDVLLKVFQSLDTYDGRSKLSTWIIRIAMNACVSHLRKATVRQAVSLPGGHETDAAQGSVRGLKLAPEDAAEPEPGSGVEHAERRRDVIAALNRLEPEVRALLVLRDVQDLDYEQIGQVLGVPVGTVKSRLFRARAALREELEGKV